MLSPCYYNTFIAQYKIINIYMQVVILCGGLATRIKPITEKVPKSMVQIAGKPFLWYQLELLKKNGIYDIVLCIGYKGEHVEQYFGNGEKFGVKIQYSSDADKLLGTGGSLKNAEHLLGDTFLMMYGDSYLPFGFKKAIAFFERNNGIGLMTVFKNLDKYEKSNVEVEKSLVKSYSKKRKTKKMEYIDYGISIFKKEALQSIPKDTWYDLSNLHKTLIKKRELLAYPAEQRPYEVGSFKGLEEFKKYITKKT